MITRATFLLAFFVAAPAWARPEPTAAEPAAEGAEAHEAGHPPPGIELLEGEGTIIPFGAMLVNFALLATLVILFGRKPIAAFLLARHRTIKDGLEEAQALKARAEARAREYAERLASFQQEIDALLEDFRKAGQAERTRILAEAEERASRLRREADFLVSQEVKQIRIDLHHELVEKAVRAAEERLRSAITPSDQERLANEYLSGLGRVGSPGART